MLTWLCEEECNLECAPLRQWQLRQDPRRPLAEQVGERGKWKLRLRRGGPRRENLVRRASSTPACHNLVLPIPALTQSG